jgi:UDP-N-acetylmuramate: L-alanyl-gamma-D-glutamyl-meso-diaminopimelate ligase
MGICGTAMGNAALLARAAGHEVLGADTGVYPPMSTVLAEAGITLHEGYDPARLARLAPDLVVIGNAMSRGNPEVEWLLDTRAIRSPRCRRCCTTGAQGRAATSSFAARTARPPRRR